jgi:hypothetical protein
MFTFLQRTMSTAAAPAFKPFNLALIQLGRVTEDKTANLSHAREMILKAARGEGASDGGRPQLVVLPVCVRERTRKYTYLKPLIGDL